KQGLWIGTRASGVYLTTDRKSFRKISTTINVKSVRGFFENGKDLWLCTDRGIVILNDLPYSNQQTAIIPDKKDPESLSGPKVNTIVKDRYGVIWVGTQESGLNRVIGFTNEKMPRFKQYAAQPGKKDALQNERISCMLSDSKGRLWIGT